MTQRNKSIYCDTTENHQNYLWITRSHHAYGVDDFAPLLSQVGLGVYHAPLVHIEHQKIDDDFLSPDDFACLMFTSVHGVDGFIKQPFFNHEQAWLNTICYGVSNKTTDYLQYLGFKDVRHGGGTAEILIQQVFDDFKEGSKPALYGRGVHITDDFKGMSGQQGFEIIQKIVYKNKYVDALDAEIATFLQHRMPNGIVVQSVKTAENLIKIIDTVAGLETVPLFCQSQNIANVFKKRTSVHVQVLQGEKPQDWAKFIKGTLDLK